MRRRCSPNTRRRKASLIAPPIPIEDIVEKHLKLGIEFDDTHRLFGVPRDAERDADILGAMFFDEARIVIDESLDPEENPAKEGRYRFTLAHEGGGHWRLHRHLFAKDPAQAHLVRWASDALRRLPVKPSQGASGVAGGFLRFLPIDAAQTDICRVGRARSRRQRCHVMDRSRREAIIAYSRCRGARVRTRGSRTGKTSRRWSDFARPFAQRFLVSPQAMRIRLEKLGLLLREVPRQRILTVADSPFFEENVKCQLDR